MTTPNRQSAEHCASGTKDDLIAVFESCKEARDAFYSIQKYRVEMKAWEAKDDNTK